MTKNELCQALFKASYLTGEFRLRSGEISNEYFDKYQFESQPQLLKEIASLWLPHVPQDTQFLGALEMGGIPLATALSLQTGLPMVFVRKQSKEYGTAKQIEGPNISEKKICLIEDVITSGGAVFDAINALKKQNAIIQKVLCVIYRGNGAFEKLHQQNIQTHALFTKEELKKAKT